MNRREFLEAGILSAAAVAVSESRSLAEMPVSSPNAEAHSRNEQVDFGYAFAPPHRITIARPEASEKTLLDLEPSLLTMSWSYQDLRANPLATLRIPPTDWHVKIQPFVDGKPFPNSTWKRGEDFLPMLDALMQDAAGTIRLEAIGAATGALVRVTAHNSDSVAHRFALVSEVLDGWVMHNPAWVEPGKDPDALVACQWDRADRVLLFGIGAAEFPVGRVTMTLEFALQPGETRNGWLVRPYAAYERELAQLRKRDWNAEFEAAKEEWKALLGRAISMQIPDDGVRNAFYACLGDLFIMREPLADGYVGILCGTEGYRSTGPFEPCLAAIALDQAGLHAEAANGMRVHLDMQEPDGNWIDPTGWAHQMWGASGYKSWAGMEHYKLTGDRSYLQALFARLAASSRWQETQRQKSRVAKGEGADVNYGLMPRGMGDGGLVGPAPGERKLIVANGAAAPVASDQPGGEMWWIKDSAIYDYFGVFYTHNVLSVFADALSVDAAEILGESDPLPELRRIHESAADDLRASLRKGAIHEDDFEWIPDSAGNPLGSRWGALYAFYPTRLLQGEDSLVSGTLEKIERNISPGGQPLHTGGLEHGAWVAITLDMVAEAHLALGHGDTAIAYLYSSLNHGTPMYTWCEERGLEPGTKETSGDRQHLWTPVAVVRFLRDALVLEQPDGLHLGLATARSWLQQGQTVGVRQAPTHFGVVTYQIKSDVENGMIRTEITPPDREQPKAIILHLRHPDGKPMRRVTVNGEPIQDFDAKNELVRLATTKEALKVEAFY